MQAAQMMSFAARKAPGLPKLRDLVRKTCQESFESPGGEMDLRFDYADTDSFLSEISEIFSYSEQLEYIENVDAFNAFSSKAKIGSNWLTLSERQRAAAVLILLEQFELRDLDDRRAAARSVLYLLQGCFMECIDDGGDPSKPSRRAEAQLVKVICENAYLLYKHGIFSALCTELVLHVESGSVAPTKTTAACMADSRDLRTLLAALCIMTECLRRDPSRADAFTSQGSGSPKHRALFADSPKEVERKLRLRQNFLGDLALPICGDQPLAVVLFNMVTRFCAGNAPHFPMRKVLLLLWKTILASLGGFDELKRLKSVYRESAGLLPCKEDTLDVTRQMRAAPPPQMPMPGESIDGLGGDGEMHGGLAAFRRIPPPPLARRQFACTVTDDAIDDTVMENEGVEGKTGEQGQDEPDRAVSSDTQTSGIPIRPRVRTVGVSDDDDELDPPDPASAKERADSPRPETVEEEQPRVVPNRTLPWSPKIREKDIEAFLEHERAKFFGFSLADDRTTLAGLPRPILESVDALRKHVYVSLGELQMRREEELSRYCFSQEEARMEPADTELLYRALLPQLPNYMIGLLKILLAAAPHSKAKSDAINILADVTLAPEKSEGGSAPSAYGRRDSFVAAATEVERGVLLTLDMNRHKEVIVKAVGAILLLIAKHFKLSHVYQFEYVSQHLTYANCIPLILKFFDQNILAYVQSRNEIVALNFPRAPLYYAATCGGPNGGVFPVLDAENIEAAVSATTTTSTGAPPLPQGFCQWRNLFSAINLLRLLNKLTKWKHSRTMMLVVFKSAPILKRALRVRHILLQLYALKLLKMQAKYLGRQWRKTNMEIMSAIYSKVRHRLNDDWAYGNETNAKPWDFQDEESTLRMNVEKFNARRYADLGVMTTSMTMSTSVVAGAAGAAGGGDYSADSNLMSILGGAATANAFGVQQDSAEFAPYDNSLQSVLGVRVELSETFKANYEKWLEHEVFRANVDWDALLRTSRGCAAIAKGQRTTAAV